MSSIKADTIKLENFISDLNSFSLSFKNHADIFNELIQKTETCWHGSKADEYRNLASSFNKTENENFYLLLSSFVDKLSEIKNLLEKTINSNKGE